MKQYPWLDMHFKHLVSNYQSKFWHHALLIKYTSGIGIELLINAISSFIMCQETNLRKDCGKCRSCMLMQAKSHPDYYFFESISKVSKSLFGINSLYEVFEKIYKYANLGGPKVIYLKNIEYLSDFEICSLLKVLEEPPSETCFLLSCKEDKKELRLLRSRSSTYRVYVPNEKLAISWLMKKIKVPLEECTASLRLSGGAPIAALNQLQPEIWSKRMNLCDTLINISITKNWLELLGMLNTKQATQYLCWLLSLLLDVMKLNLGSKSFNNIDILNVIDLLSNYLDDIKILQTILDYIYNTRKQLLTSPGVNREVLLISLLLDIEKIMYDTTLS